MCRESAERPAISTAVDPVRPFLRHRLPVPTWMVTVPTTSPKATAKLVRTCRHSAGRPAISTAVDPVRPFLRRRLLVPTWMVPVLTTSPRATAKIASTYERIARKLVGFVDRPQLRQQFHPH